MTSTTVPVLSRHQIDFYHAEGYLFLRGVFSPEEIAEASREADELLAREELRLQNNLRTRWRPHHETGRPVFDVFDPVIDVAPAMGRIALDRRIMDPLDQLYGEPSCLFKEKLIYKAPGAVGATLHQDWIAWPGFPKSFLTVIVAIDPFTPENGCTEVFPRSHGDEYLSAKDGNHHYLEVHQLKCREPVPLLLEPGDLAIFGCFTPHRSAPNYSRRWRRGLFVSYNKRSEGGEQRAAHYDEYNVWRTNLKTPEERAELIYR